MIMYLIVSLLFTVLFQLEMNVLTDMFHMAHYQIIFRIWLNISGSNVSTWMNWFLKRLGETKAINLLEVLGKFYAFVLNDHFH